MSQLYTCAGTPTTDIYIQYLIDSQLRMQSVNMQKTSYLVFKAGRFQGSVPMNDSDIFEMEPVGPSSVALRLVNYNELLRLQKEQEENNTDSGSGTGSGDEQETVEGAAEEGEGTLESETAEEGTAEEGTQEDEAAVVEETMLVESGAVCYLGFSRIDNRPTCYPSTEYAATRFVIIH